VGAAPALNGAYRLSNANKVTWRNQGGTADYCGAMVDTSNNLYIGSNDADAEKVSVVIINGASGAYLKAAGAYQIVLDGTSINAYVPIVGGGTSPYSVHGGVPVSVTATPQALTAAQYSLDMIKLSSVLGAGFTVTVPAPASMAAGYYKTYWNTSTVAATISTGAGTTRTVIAGAAQRMWHDNSGVSNAGPSYTP